MSGRGQSSAQAPGRVVHCKREAHEVYIGRPGPWGNPFRVEDEAGRAAAVEQFRAWGERQPWFIDAARRELVGATLGCWCAPKACHGDVLAAWAAQQPNEPSWVMVFGSNEAGRHGKGAALDAARHYGAEAGVGSGATGQAWALPTKDASLRTLPLTRVAQEVETLKVHAAQHPQTQFQVTRVGCGLAGYRDEEIAPLFEGAPRNMHLPGRWERMLNPAAVPRVVVCGSRSFDDSGFLDGCLNRLAERFKGPFEVVSGGARGADLLGEDFALAGGLPLSRFPALWRSQGRAAGMRRNQTMAWYGTHVVAFWDGQSAGTRGMIDLAKAEGLPVWVPSHRQCSTASTTGEAPSPRISTNSAERTTRAIAHGGLR